MGYYNQTAQSSSFPSTPPVETKASRIEVCFKKSVKDAFADGVLASAKQAGHPVKSLEVVEVYTIVGIRDFYRLEKIAKELLADPLLQEYSVNEPLALQEGKKFDFALEISFKPRVTDNAGRTTAQAIKDFFPAFDGKAFYSRQYLFTGSVNEKLIQEFASKTLANGLIEEWGIKSFQAFEAEQGFKAKTYSSEPHRDFAVQEIELEGKNDAFLEKLSKERLLALNTEEMRAIQKQFRDRSFLKKRKEAGLNEKITDVELESIAQTWSEHCKHKIFNSLIEYSDSNGKKEEINSLFKTYIKKSTEKIASPFLLSVFKDNAGIIKFNKSWNLAIKVETHNSPCALDPYGGAVTGIVGVNRDVLGAGLGARPIFNTDVFCFASPDYSGVYPRVHPKRVLQGVVKGIQDGGNKSGIPTINGSIVFDDSFAGKPLVYCGTGGIMPANVKGKPSHEKKAKPENAIVMVGGKVGKDGIHGATFSSLGLSEDSPTSAVQIGDPFTQKKVLDFLMEARDHGMIESVTDNGAGGLSSSIGEMALQSGGAELHLDKVPLKYAGLQPWEVFVSESQERMTLAVTQEHLPALMELAKKHEVEATALGKFTRTGFIHVLHNSKTAALLELKFLHEPPQLKLKARERKRHEGKPVFKKPSSLGVMLKKILSRPNVCSKEEIVRRYDHEVQGTSVLKPFVGKNNDGPSDSAVIKPLYDSPEGIVISNGLCPKYSKIDVGIMAANALDEAVRNAIASGASLEYMAVLDNFCWPDPVQSRQTPDGEEKLGDLVKACKALYETTLAYGTPCISGKDSMKNDAFVGGRKISVLPTLLFTAIGKTSDVEKTVSMDFKNEGDFIYAIGETKNELGESEYLQELKVGGGKAPSVNALENKKTYNALSKSISKSLVASCHDCSDGGMGIALAESCIAGDVGAEIFLQTAPRSTETNRDDIVLYSESAGRFIASVERKNAGEFEKTLFSAVVKFAKIGMVKGKKLSIKGIEGKKIVEEKTEELSKAWKSKRWF